MKPFTYGKFVKKCLLVVVDTVCPEKKLSENISLSALSVTRRIKNMTFVLKEKLKRALENFEYYSVALHESLTFMMQPSLSEV